MTAGLYGKGLDGGPGRLHAKESKPAPLSPCSPLQPTHGASGAGLLAAPTTTIARTRQLGICPVTRKPQSRIPSARRGRGSVLVWTAHRLDTTATRLQPTSTSHPTCHMSDVSVRSLEGAKQEAAWRWPFVCVWACLRFGPGVQGAIPPKSSARRVVVRHEAPRRLMAPDRRPAGLPRPQRA